MAQASDISREIIDANSMQGYQNASSLHPLNSISSEGAAISEHDEFDLQMNKNYKPVFIPIDPVADSLVNCEFIRSEMVNYANKFTQFGEVTYSPRYQDDRYIYRHVILTRKVRKAAEELAAKSSNGLLSEAQFIHVLGIDLSPGWEHFMRFKNRLCELILRRPLPEDAHHDGAPKEGDEVTDEDPCQSSDEAENLSSLQPISKKVKVTARRQSSGAKRK